MTEKEWLRDVLSQNEPNYEAIEKACLQAARPRFRRWIPYAAAAVIAVTALAVFLWRQAADRPIKPDDPIETISETPSGPETPSTPGTPTIPTIPVPASTPSYFLQYAPLNAGGGTGGFLFREWPNEAFYRESGKIYDDVQNVDGLAYVPPLLRPTYEQDLDYYPPTDFSAAENLLLSRFSSFLRTLGDEMTDYVRVPAPEAEEDGVPWVSFPGETLEKNTYVITRENAPGGWRLCADLDGEALFYVTSGGMRLLYRDDASLLPDLEALVPEQDAEQACRLVASDPYAAAFLRFLGITKLAYAIDWHEVTSARHIADDARSQSRPLYTLPFPEMTLYEQTGDPAADAEALLTAGVRLNVRLEVTQGEGTSEKRAKASLVSGATGNAPTGVSTLSAEKTEDPRIVPADYAEAKKRADAFADGDFLYTGVEYYQSVDGKYLVPFYLFHYSLFDGERGQIVYVRKEPAYDLTAYFAGTPYAESDPPAAPETMTCQPPLLQTNYRFWSLGVGVNPTVCLLFDETNYHLSGDPQSAPYRYVYSVLGESGSWTFDPDFTYGEKRTIRGATLLGDNGEGLILENTEGNGFLLVLDGQVNVPLEFVNGQMYDLP